MLLLPTGEQHRPQADCEGDADAADGFTVIGRPSSDVRAMVHAMPLSWADDFEALAGPLGPTRTPAIMAASIRHYNELRGESLPLRDMPSVKVPRGLQPDIGLDLLASYAILVWNDEDLWCTAQP